MLITSIGLGLAVSFLYYCFVGLVPGGLIVAGYIALYVDHPLRILMTFIASIVTFYFVKKVVFPYTILYGRRRFMAMVLVGFVVKWLSDYVLTSLGSGIDMRVIGYIITGLIANSFAEQGIFVTIGSIIIVSVIVRLMLILYLF